MCFTKTRRIGAPSGPSLAGMGGHDYFPPSLSPDEKWVSLCAFVTLLFTSLRGNSRHSRKTLSALSLLETGQARSQPPKLPKSRLIQPAKAHLQNFFLADHRSFHLLTHHSKIDCHSKQGKQVLGLQNRQNYSQLSAIKQFSEIFFSRPGARLVSSRSGYQRELSSNLTREYLLYSRRSFGTSAIPNSRSIKPY
jgi:hypothetical protein